MSPPSRPGRLVLFLHAHLPYVRHVDRENALEEDWLFEAITDVYLPLCRLLDRWNADRVPVRIALSVSPTLTVMLRDRLLLQRYAKRLEDLLALARRERRRTSDGPLAPLAESNAHRFEAARTDFFETYDGDLVEAFARAQRRGQLELCTTAATHAFLPHHALHPELVHAQLAVAIRSHHTAFGAAPHGIWLPECGYVPGLDEHLADVGLAYFVMDTHGVTNADPPPVFGHYAPVVCASGVVAFPRDPAASAAVWSDRHGYPGAPEYQERHRDAGFDLDAEALGPLLLDGGQRRSVGIKYHRITGRDVPLGDKALYDPAAAAARIHADAEHFVRTRIDDAVHFARTRDRPAVLVAPYDAELFGHWWFEGPAFLDAVVRNIANTDAIALATPRDVLDAGERFQLTAPAHSSWGAGGYGWTWLNETTDWILPRLHAATERLWSKLPARPHDQRALRQAARELLLACASDWPFILTNDSVVEYATARVKQHLDDFERLTRTIDEPTLAALERAHPIFPGLQLADLSPEDS